MVAPNSYVAHYDSDGVFKPTTKVTLDDGTEIDFKQSGQPLRRTLQPVSGPQKVGDEYLYLRLNGSYKRVLRSDFLQ